MKYSETFLRYFNNLAHAGEIDMVTSNIVDATMGNHANGDLVTLKLAIEHAKILQARFKASGAPATIAAAEFICTWLTNKEVDVVVDSDIVGIVLEELDLSSHYVHIASLIKRVVMECIRKYREGTQSYL